jgi:methionine-rich copper-binding protein CopC
MLPRRTLGVATLSYVLLSRPADAHAILTESQPPANGSVPAGPLILRLRFNSRIDRPRSLLTLVRPDKSRTELTLNPDDPPDVLSAKAVVTAGPHVLRWQVLAIDGHITRGDLPFTATEA